MSHINKSRRKFVQKVAYMAPMIATISVIPSIASAGSVRHGNNDAGNGADCLPSGLKRNGKSFLDNDDRGGKPKSPQSRRSTTRVTKRERH
jgi:hypothetical protein